MTFAMSGGSDDRYLGRYFDELAATTLHHPSNDRRHRPSGPPPPGDQGPWADLVSDAVRRLRALAVRWEGPTHLSP